MNLFSIFSSAPKAVDGVFDKDNGLLTQFGEFVGNAKFTEEEKAELTAKQAEDVRKFVVDTLSERTDRSKSRRNIAELVIKFFVLMLFLSGLVFPFNPEWSAIWLSLAINVPVGGLVSAVSVFFFGSHLITRHNETRNK